MILVWSFATLEAFCLIIMIPDDLKQQRLLKAEKEASNNCIFIILILDSEESET